MNKLEDIFKNTDPDKRDRIINSALEEFSKNSFEKASTNNIVKNAGISKGLLYHYFQSKKELYEQLQIFVMKTMTDAILKNIDWEESDLFNRLKQISLIKLEVCMQYPYIIEFSKNMFKNKSLEELKKVIQDYAPNIYMDTYTRNIDFSLFKDGIDVQKVIKMTEWVIERLGEEWMKQHAFSSEKVELEDLFTEFDEYLDLFKTAFYKNNA